MNDPAFQRGEIDIQLLERRADLLDPAPSPDLILELAIAAALAEAEARHSRRPAVATANEQESEWGRLARSEGHR
jgi:hypothetical protein